MIQRKSLVSYSIAVLAIAGTLHGLPAHGQSPLDVRVLYERLDRLEAQLRDAQGMAPAAPAMPLAPEETGMDSQPLPADVASRLQVRILQLERLVESMTGQLEQTQFEVAQLRAQVQQMSNDVSYRLAVLEQAAGISSAVAAAPPPQQTALANQFQSSTGQPGGTVAPPAQLPGQPPSTTMAQRQAAMNAPQSPPVSGRFEPDLDMPMSQPVQPQPQMTTPALAQPGAEPGLQTADEMAGQSPAGTVMLAPGETLTAPSQAGPVNQGNTFGLVRTDEDGNVLPPAPGAASAPVQAPIQQPAPPPQIAAAPSPGPVASAQIGTGPANPQLAMTSLPEGTPQQQYDYAFDILRRADYARAETALRLFLDANPQDTLAGNAQYWLGETYYVRGDFEQAAVEFLSGYQTYPNSNKAPDNLLKLGLSMARLGQTDGACTALSRLGTEYPDANDTIRRRAQTERARLSCS